MDSGYARVQIPHRQKVYLPWVRGFGKGVRRLHLVFGKASEAADYARRVARRYEGFCRSVQAQKVEVGREAVRD